MPTKTINVADILAMALGAPGTGASEAAGDSEEIPAELAALVGEFARNLGVSPEEVVRRALSLAGRVEIARALGGHLGLVSDAGKLEAELTAGGGLVTDLVRRLKPDEHDDERQARLRAEGRAALLDDIKGFVLFIVLLGVLLGVGSLCLHLIFFRGDSSPETQRWAQTILAALVSGSVSFLVGRKVGGK